MGSDTSGWLQEYCHLSAFTRADLSSVYIRLSGFALFHEYFDVCMFTD